MRFSLLFFLFGLSPSHAGIIVTDVPSSPDSTKTYLIYLHGQIIEASGPHPTDPRFGPYDYAGILEALSSEGAVVISAQRPRDTDVNEYAGVVVAQVERLLHDGVPAENIVIAGFSKGGAIAVHVSSFLRRSQIRFVLLAACWPRPEEPQLRLTGRILSLYESSDTLTGSCKELTDHPEKPQSFKEIKLSTGKGHGAFYTPLPAWVKPVLAWVNARDG